MKKEYNVQKNQTQAKHKIDPNFPISFTNIRALRFNYPKFELYFQEVKPDLLFISKTEINDSISIQDITDYSPLLTKEEPLNRHGHGLGAYITDRFPYCIDTKKEDPDFLLALVHILFFFNAYHPQDDGIAISD